MVMTSQGTEEFGADACLNNSSAMDGPRFGINNKAEIM